MQRKRWLTALLGLLGAAPALAQDPVTRVSVDSLGVEGDGPSGVDSPPSISDDGAQVAFDSQAANLVAGDNNGFSDVFVHDRSTGETTRVSVPSDGGQGDGVSGDSSISADGLHVTFSSIGSNLVAGDTNDSSDVFIRSP